jgi:serine/threonine protein kinase
VHQDLKPENVLIKTEMDRPVAYLGDVGVAKKFNNEGSLKRAHTLTTRPGTEEWMAPEMRNPFLLKLGKNDEDNKLNFS